MRFTFELSYLLFIGLFFSILVATHKLLKLPWAKCSVATCQALLFEHLLDLLLQSVESLPLLPDDVFLEVADPLVDRVLDGCLVVFWNLHSIPDLFR